jgi:DNA polymerase-3 subunit delta'
MLLREVLGQDELKKQFLLACAEQRVGHAYLLAGPPGFGGLPLAIAFARYLSCENRQGDDACMECPSCSKYSRLVHPDLHFVFPVNKGMKDIKEPVSDDYIQEWRQFVLASPYFTPNEWYSQIGIENKQGVISAHESEMIIRKLNLKTFESSFKIMIIWLPEKMHPAAANKLLKTLEEPYPGTVFFLVSESPDQLLSTILSRTQVLRLSSIDDASLEASLQQEFTLSPAQRKQVIRLACGDYQRARDYALSGEEASQQLELFKRFMRNSYGFRIQDMNAWVDEISALGRERQKDFLAYALRMVRENILLTIVPAHKKEMTHITDDEAEFCKKFSAFIHPGNVQHVTEELTLASRHIEANGNARIIFMDLCLKMSSWIRS